MKTENISMCLYDENRETRRVYVKAYVIGDFALHRAVKLDGAERIPRRWTISHIPTGSKIMSALPYVTGKPRKGLAPMRAYLTWMREVQDTGEYRMWASAMADAPFGLESPSKLGGRAVDASRLFAAKARSMDEAFLP